MKCPHTLLASAALAAAAATFTALVPASVSAQEPIIVPENREALFTDADPVLHANKQATLRILHDLIQCNRWDEAEKYLTDRYLQHNPNVKSGRDNVLKFFGPPARTPNCPDKLTMPVVTVLTSGNIVGIVFRQEYDHPTKPGEKYATIFYDQWRIVDGRADEHWDTSLLEPPK
jgi:predicted SnoaL-like aldol condensation-catalyzing enzyme